MDLQCITQPRIINISKIIIKAQAIKKVNFKDQLKNNISQISKS
jgi:hypothetical protein